MTPKEKAKELYDKIHFVLPSYHDEGQQEHIAAKECAIIAVGEIIKSLRKDLPEIGLGKGYWYEVKQEIEKL